MATIRSTFARWFLRNRFPRFREGDGVWKLELGQERHNGPVIYIGCVNPAGSLALARFRKSITDPVQRKAFDLAVLRHQFRHLSNGELYFKRHLLDP